MAKGRGGRRYVRDAIGRFAPKGYSGQTSGTGSRLKGDGKQRAGGGKVVSPKGISGATSNTISKSSTKRQVNANSRKVEARIKKQTAERSGLQASNRIDSLLRKEKAARKSNNSGSARAKSANNARPTGGLTKPAPQGNIRRTNARLGPNNNIKPGPKSPRTKINNVLKKAKELKGSGEKLRDVRKKADALRGKFLKQDKGRIKKAFDKPSVTDKRSRDYLGKLTKEGKRQDPGTGGKKKGRKKPKKP